MEKVSNPWREAIEGQGAIKGEKDG